MRPYSVLPELRGARDRLNNVGFRGHVRAAGTHAQSSLRGPSNDFDAGLHAWLVLEHLSRLSAVYACHRRAKIHRE